MEYIKFIKKALIVVVVVGIIDQLTGFLLRSIYFGQVRGEYKEATYVMDSVKTEGLVFGSSRASHHYIPEVLEDRLQLTFYNAGRDGCGLLYNYAAFKSVVKRHIPKLVIFDLSPDELYNTKSEYDRLAYLLPYYKDHFEIRDVVCLRGRFENFKLLSACYPFNSQLVSIIKGSVNMSNENIFDQKGYLPLYNKMKGSVANNSLKLTGHVIDSNKVKALYDISNICQTKHIQLFFVCSPIFNNAGKISAEEKITQIVSSYRIKFFDFSGDTTFDNHPEYFHDNGHLNLQGATLFSKTVSDKLTEKY